MIPKKEVIPFPNNKPYIIKEVKVCINKKKWLFKNKDQRWLIEAQKVLNKMLKKAREKHREKFEQSFGRQKIKKWWDTMKQATNMTSGNKQLNIPNELK